MTASSEKVPSIMRKNAQIQIILHMRNVSSGPRGYKTFSCSTQLSMKFTLLINLKFLTIANYFLLNIAEHEILFANKYENANYCWYFQIY